MDHNQKSRIIKLEERQSKSDQKKDYCPCMYCMPKLGNFHKITEAKAERICNILKSFKIQKEDGTMTNAYESTMARKAERGPSNCNH